MAKPGSALLAKAGRTGRVYRLAVAVWLFWATPVVFAATLTGHVELIDKGAGRALDTAEIRDAVVFFQPSEAPPVRPLDRPPRMVTVDKEFRPRVLTATVGSTVSFPNQDPILHNVFSVSSGNSFDLGFYKKGEGKEWTFDRLGLVRVYCNVHYDMVGYILVLDTPFYVSPDARGNFRLDNLPPGPGRLTVWQERAKPWSQQLAIPTKAPVEIPLEVVRPRVPKHSNKFGKPYQRGERGQRYR